LIASPATVTGDTVSPGDFQCFPKARAVDFEKQQLDDWMHIAKGEQYYHEACTYKARVAVVMNAKGWMCMTSK
jgi:hypothetical protein